MYKSNVTEQVNGAVNQIDTMLFVAYILRESFDPISSQPVVDEKNNNWILQGTRIFNF